MKRWEEFKTIREANFDNVDMQGSSMMDMIRRTRRQLAQNIKEMIAEGEVDPKMTVAQLLQMLEA
jgi:hypothetical protein